MKRSFLGLVSLGLLGAVSLTSTASAQFTGSGTYTIGAGGDYTTLAAFLDDVTKVRELTGLISSSGTTITGTGTLFTTEVAVGDRILTSTGAFRGAAQILLVTAVNSDTDLTVSVAPTAAITNLKATRQKSTFPTTLTGNATGLITGNLTETVNSMIVLNTNGFTFTLKPQVATTPTVTFTRAEDQAGFTGHLIIGGNNAGANAILTDTDNIVIDGSNSVGGTSRDLTFATAVTYASSVLIHATGDVDNLQIKNANILNNGTSTGSGVSGIRLTSLQYAAGTTDFTAAGYAAAGSYTPDNFLIENNTVTVNSVATQGHGVNITSLGTITVGTAANGFTIRGNDITANLRGIFISPGYGYTIEDNVITVPGAAGFDTFGVFQNTANTPPAHTTTVQDNVIYVANASTTTATNGPRGIHFSTGGTGLDRVYRAINNSITLVNTGNRNAGVLAVTGGIVNGNAVTMRAYNNTIYIAENTVSANTQGANTNAGAITGPTTNVLYDYDARNNIIIVEEGNIAGLLFAGLPTGAGAVRNSNNNIIQVSNGALTGRIGGTGYPTLAAFQTASGHDQFSDQFDIKSQLVDTTIPGTDLRLTAAAGRLVSQYGAAPLALVPEDFEEQDRDAFHPYRGFDELAAALNNTAPSNLLLSSTSIAENSANATVVGTLSATDPDAGDTITYSLTDNAGGAFSLSGNTLSVANSSLLNTEVNPTLTITAVASDEASSTTSENIIITITNVNEAPTTVTLTPSTVAENTATGTGVGTLVSQDPDASSAHTYTLVAGAGDTHNGLFTIVGDQVQVNGALDYEALPSTLSIRVQSTDNGTPAQSLQAILLITLTDVVESSVSDWSLLNE